MSKINKIEVCVAEGTGAGYGAPAHKYACGHAVVWARSLKNGVRQAEKLADRRLDDGWRKQGIPTGQIPVDGWIKINEKFV